MGFVVEDAYSYRPGYNPAFLAKQKRLREEAKKREEEERAAEAKRKVEEGIEARKQALLKRVEEREAARIKNEKAQAEKIEEIEKKLGIEKLHPALTSRGNVDLLKSRLLASELERIHDEIISEGMSAKEIILSVAIEHNVQIADIVGSSREKPITRARQLAMWEVRKRRPNLSTTQIGKIFNRDHTTVIHALQKIQKEKDAEASKRA